MRVINRGHVNVEEWPKRVTCHRCQSLLELTLEDLHFGWYTSSYDSYGDTIHSGVYIHCPVCPPTASGPQQVRILAVLEETIREVGALREQTSKETNDVEQ